MKRDHTMKISKCHPKNHTIKKRCLPQHVYEKSHGTIRGDHEIVDSLDISKTKRKRLRKLLRPRMPKEWKIKPDTWLDNFNIENVLKQYEEMYPWYRNLGIFPIDFSAPNPYTKDNNQCLFPETCNINIKKNYLQGKQAISIVFNLDPHYKDGSHWVGLYIDFHNLEKPWVAYFDSYGYTPPSLIARLMRSLRLQHPKIKLMYNAKRVQYGHTECGMFVLFFLISMLSGMPFRKFCRLDINDETMLELRKVLFSL